MRSVEVLGLVMQGDVGSLSSKLRNVRPRNEAVDLHDRPGSTNRLLNV